MYEEREALFDKLQTSNAIKNLVSKYAEDLNSVFVDDNKEKTPLSKLSITDFFNVVKNIPYRKDIKPIEVISRPFHILNHRALGMDCKKKSVLVASYFKLRKIPYRFIGSSRRPDKKIHHIFVQARTLPDETLTKEYHNYDATYSNYTPDQEKKVTAFEVL